MKKYIELNLGLFDGEAGGEGAAAEEVAGGGGEGAAGGIGEAAGEDNLEKSLEERQKEFAKLIQGEYKDLYESGLNEVKVRSESELRNLGEQLKKQNQLIDLMSARYDVESGKIEDIMKAIDKDDAFYEEAALKEGMNVEQYKNMLRMRTQNKQLLEAQRKSEQIRQRDETWNRWDMESEICKKQFPNFDMNIEGQNPNFIRLLGAGMDVTSAYKSCHFDEIMQGLIVKAEMETKKSIADTVRAGAGRPLENQLGGNAVADGKTDVGKLTNKEIEELIERVKSGELIEL